MIKINCLIARSLILLAFTCASAFANQATFNVFESENDKAAQEKWAYSLGLQAYVFGLPLVVYEREYALRTNRAKIERIRAKCPCAMVNEVGHKFELATADDVMPYTPNNDTVYSGGVIDVREEPIIMSLPDVDDRYWSVQVANPYTENLFYIGTRATQGKGGHHAFVSQNWKGQLPPNVTEHRVSYDAVMFAVRYAVKPNSDADLKQVHALQKQVQLTSLSHFKAGNLGTADMPKGIEQRPNHKGDPLAFFKLMNDLLGLYPPEPQHQAMVNAFKLIGIEPGKAFNDSALTDAMRKGLMRAQKDGRDIMRWKVKYRGTPYAARWNNLHPGDYFFDYFDRAAGALEGLFVHSREEAVYFSTYESGDGEFLDGNKQYRLHFEKDQLPPTQDNGFWSLTMYSREFQLVKNAINRYSIGDRSEGLEYNEDGSLDIYIQATPPEGKESNWLPSPPEGIFRINFRMYLPEEQARSPETLEQFIPPILAP